MGRPVPDCLVIPVTAKTGIDTGVPLSDLGGDITFLPEDARPKTTDRRIVSAAWILALHPHRFDGVRMQSGQQTGARRHAPRAKVGVGEADTRLRQFIDVRGMRPGQGFWITGDRLVRLVIAVEKQDVWPLRRR